jgi:hypothetical protein
MRDAVGDDASLACPGTGQDQNRAFDGLNGLSLLWIQRNQIQHHARSLVGAKVKTNGKSLRRLRFFVEKCVGMCPSPESSTQNAFWLAGLAAGGKLFVQQTIAMW